MTVMNSQVHHQKAATEENQAVLKTTVNVINSKFLDLQYESELDVKIDRRVNQLNKMDGLVELCAFVNKRNEEIKQFTWPLPTFAKEISSASESSVSSSKSINNKNLQFNFNPLTYSLPLTQALTAQNKESEVLNTLKRSLLESRSTERNNEFLIYNTSENLADRKDSTTSSENIQRCHKIDYVSLYGKAFSKTPRFMSSDVNSSELKILQQRKKCEVSNIEFLRVAAMKVSNDRHKY